MKTKTLPFFIPSIVVTASSLFTMSPLQAAKTWSGATNANWSTTTNWVEGALPGTTETVNFDVSSTLNLGAINLEAARTIRGISLTNPAGPVTTLAGFTLTLAGGGIDMSSATQDLVLNSPVAIGAGKQYWNVIPGHSITTEAIPAKAVSTAGVVQFGTTGSIKLGAAASNLLVDAQNNAWGTFGSNDWAALNATGNVIAATYTPATATITTGVINDIQGNIGAITSTALISALRFDSATSYNVDVANSNTSRTSTIGGILVTANAAASSIGGNGRTNAFIRPNRSSGGAAHTFNVIQNSPNDFTIAAIIGNSSSSTGVLVKSGPGRLILTGANGYRSGTVIHEGTIQVGNGGTVGFVGGGDITNNAELVFNRSDTVTLIHNISGTGNLTQLGPGELDLTTSVSTFTGAVNISGGTLGVTALANLGGGTSLNINGGTFKFLGDIDPSGRAVAIGAGGATFDTNGRNITFANAVGNGGSGGFTKAGAGSLALTQPAGWSGGTTVDGGLLLANNTTGSATSGAVTVNAAGGVGGTGTIGGAVTTTSGSIVSPGNSAVGTLTVGSLDLEAGSVTNVEFGTGNDLVNVTNGGGLLVNGGIVNLYQEGTNLGTPFSGVPGTYNLFQYSGTLGGAATNLAVGNPQPGKGYSFSASGGFVKLTIIDTGVNRNWITNGGGSWGNAANWNGTVPNVSQAVVNFITPLSAPATVTLDGAKTAGNLIFTSIPNGYTINPGSGGSLTLANGSVNASILVNSGTHSINTPLVLNNHLSISVPPSGGSLTLGGIVSGTGKSVTKTGSGDLFLNGANTFTGEISLTGGTTRFGPAGLGAGNISLDQTALVWNPGNTEDITSGGRTVRLVDGLITFDTDSNTVLISNSLGEGGNGGLQKTGDGTLVLAGENTYFGGTSILAGTLQLGNGGADGFISGTILNNTELVINRSTDFTLDGSISGTGTLTKLASNTLTLAGSNTYSGPTDLQAGSLILGNSLALQNTSLDYNTGSLLFSGISAATIGGFTGTKDLALQDDLLNPVALTVGGAGGSGNYSGVLSGTGSFIKAGAGALVLDNANTYAGATGMNAGGGVLELSGTGKIATTALNMGTTTRFLVNGGTFSSSAQSTIDSRGFVLASGFNLVAGSAAFNGGVRTGTSDGTLISVENGTFTATDVILQRTRNFNNLPAGPSSNATTYTEADAAVVDGFVVSGGTANISGLLTISTSNSGSSALFSGGDTTVAGVITVGNAANDRWSLLQVSGGTFTSSEAVTGVVLSPHATSANKAMLKFSGGVSTLQRVAFGAASGTSGTGVVWLKGGELYLGSGGLVQEAPVFTSSIRLTSGLLGAAGAWGTAIPVSLEGGIVIKAADASGAPHDINFGGAFTGAGSLTKTGTGIVTLAGANAYTGSTTVEEGTLRLPTDDVLSDTAALNVATGAFLNLTHTGTDTVSDFQIDGVSQASGTYGGSGSGAQHIIPQITGTGKIFVPVSDPFVAWSAGFGLTGNDALPSADPDHDGQSNLLEFALNGSPISSTASGKTRSAVAVVGGENALTYTLPVRVGAAFTGDTSKSAAIAGLTYTIQGSDELSDWETMIITEVVPALSADLPDLDDDWTYRTFRTPGTVAADPKDFIRARVLK
ncbi:autotransporter-associated beta strand repeat-containing protein [Luteolibacter yonseiensis]|uniref:Autotransporter-associated beta strand repeat-containing protein n=1 Tax=Luteolibacter yonseiensis TaxID=1144680 RepID=A0A934R4K1_9BACT|nr:autotransporter-associated beta strand repeat-containing protein [Luteolibacter yonseiensis]MBK1816807.1 autotransporter-associated beta strand repeat-containing protein [Luteolibacter yonseiensis]